jgi:hypothetical protein
MDRKTDTVFVLQFHLTNFGKKLHKVDNLSYLMFHKVVFAD